MKSWNNQINKRALNDMQEYKKQIQIAPYERDNKKIKRLERRLGLV